MVDETAGMDKEVKFRIQSGWNNWRKVPGVLCDGRVPFRLNGKVHKAVVRPALTYGLEAAPLKKLEEKKLDVAEMKMLRWMVGVTKRDKIRNDYIRGTVKVVEFSKKIQEARQRWCHLRRAGEDHVVYFMEMEVFRHGRFTLCTSKGYVRKCESEDPKSETACPKILEISPN
ncbi:uncharacterized protein LOC119575988 [Penaeus monodon]|uniref:uncharacterized protein LOC119575988 n=1 Tax=Penaeus monodon TaxID=6687 RepID=UPI0018A7A9A5|nr:uncharacterized protein LOC119575988 [Penaeus monodon]